MDHEQRLVCTIHEHIVAPKWLAASELLRRGDSPGFAIHQFRYAAKQELMELLSMLLEWRDQHPLTGPVSSLVFSMAVCRTMCTIGQTIFDTSETLEGYRWVADACLLLIDVLATGSSVDAKHVAALWDQRKQTIHVAPKHEALWSVPDLTFTGGLGLLLEMYLFLATAWSRWSDDAVALRIIEQAQLIASKSRFHVHVSKKLEILDDAQRRHAESAELRNNERSAQSAALAAKLEERRRKHQSGSGVPTNTGSCGPSEAVSMGVGDQTALASSWPMPALDWMRWKAVASSSPFEAIKSGAVEDETRVKDLECSVMMCCAQILKSQNALQKSAFYCHKALQDKLNVPGTDIKEWVVAVLQLVDWYLLSMDLSHAEHCLGAAKLLMHANHLTLGAIDGASAVDVAFFEATLNTRLLQLCDNVRKAHDAPYGRVLTQLFLNPLLPPEDVRNAPELTAVKNADWGSPERIAFSSIVGLAPPRSGILVEWGPSTGGTADALCRMDAIQAAIATCLASVTVEEDCERYLELLRLEATALNATLAFAPEAVQLLHRRITVLTSILSIELNPVAFRNVIRQAEYDLGSTYLALAGKERTTAATSDDDLVTALMYFHRFTSGFEKEIADARKVDRGVADILDDSDYPSYSVGCLQVGMLLLKLKRTKEAATAFKNLLAFLKANPKAVENYPVLGEHANQCDELLALLGEAAGDQSSSTHAPLRSAGTKATTVSLQVPLRGAPRIKATRPLGGGTRK